MSPRLLGSAAAVLSASLATGADPIPLPPVALDPVAVPKVAAPEPRPASAPLPFWGLVPSDATTDEPVVTSGPVSVPEPPKPADTANLGLPDLPQGLPELPEGLPELPTDLPPIESGTANWRRANPAVQPQPVASPPVERPLVQPSPILQPGLPAVDGPVPPTGEGPGVAAPPGQLPPIAPAPHPAGEGPPAMPVPGVVEMPPGVAAVGMAPPGVAMVGMGAGCDTCAPPPAPSPAVCDDHLGPWYNVWVRPGYKLLWIKDAPVTGAIAANNPLTAAANAQILLGNQDVNYGAFNGGSIEAGMWLNERNTIGARLGLFLTEQQSEVSSVGSDGTGNPRIVRPFFDTSLATPGQNALIVSNPGTFAGGIALQTGARLAGANVDGMVNLFNTPQLTGNVFGGFRYLDLDEYLTVTQVSQGLGTNTVPFFGSGQTAPGVMITDRFRTRNQFFGGQAGGNLEYRHGMAFARVGTSVALGPVRQATQVTGQTINPANGMGGPGGFLAVQPVLTPATNTTVIPDGNIGETTTSRFAVLSDVNTMIGIQVSERFRVGIGYEFLYLNSVARPGRQIATTIDPRIVPTLPAFGGQPPSSTALGGPGTPPLTLFDRDDFFAHGVTFLVELQY